MATDVLGFASKATKGSPKAILSSNGTQKDINSIKKKAGALADVVGQGADDSYTTFVKQQQQQKQAQVKQQQSQQQAQAQKQAQNNSLFNKVKNFATNTVVKPLVTTGEKTLNTTGAAVGGTLDLSKAAFDAAHGNQKAAQSTAAKGNKTIDSLLTKGLGGVGGYATPQQASSSGGGTKSLVKNFIKPTVHAAADIAPLVIPVGRASEGGKLVANALKTGAQNAAVTAGSTAADQAVNGKLNAKEIAKSAAYGAALGGGSEFLHAGAKGTGTAIRDEANKSGTVLNKVNNNVSALTGDATAAKTLHQQQVQQSLFDLADRLHPTTKEAAIARDSTVLQHEPVTHEAAPVAPQKPLPAPSSDHPITQAFDKIYAGGSGKGGDEAKAADYIRSNPEKAMNDYDARIKDKFGATNVVSGDESKYIIPGFDSTKSVAYHEPASALAKVKYQQLLGDASTKDKPVLLMAGGSGAGKTSALKRLGINYDNYAAVIDTNSNKLDSAQGRINQALNSGRHVEVFYVHRDPVKALTHGVIPRGGKEGRIVPIDTHIDTHYGSHDAVHKLAEHYQDDSRVAFTVASNNHGHGKAKEIELDQIPKMSYNREQIKPLLQKAVDDAHQEGKISPEEHAAYHGSNPVGETGNHVQAVGKAASPEPRQQPEPQRTPGPARGAVQTGSQVTDSAVTKPVTGTSKVAQRIAKDLKSEYGDLAEYEKINIKDQADRAAKLVGDREKLEQVISGEQSLPSGLRATSVITAVRNDPELVKDGELLKKLASSHLASESSYSAQELRLARENAKHDPVQAIKSIQDAKVKASEQKTGKTVTQHESADRKAIRAATPKVTKETWSSFVESIKC